MGTDHRLLRGLQGELGRRRQQGVAQRRMAGEDDLCGDDAFMHGKALVQEVVTDHEAQLAESGAGGLTWEERTDLVQALEARLFGAGSLQALLEDDTVEDININGYQRVFVSRTDGTKQQVAPVAASDEELVETIQLLAAHEGRSARAFDPANVRVTLRLPDGSRLHAVQAVTGQPCVSIRKHRYMQLNLKDLVALGTIEEEAADFLRALVAARKNLMFAGATGAGKTTTLRGVAQEISPQERLITVERSLELGLDEDTEAHPDCVAMEEREPNAEGVGAVSMRDMVGRDTSRMKPDRVIVGEVLGDEIITMLNAMTAGHDGSLSTIHANSSHDVIERINTYAIQAPEHLGWEATLQLTSTALDFVIFQRAIKTPEGGQVRKITSILEIKGLSADRRQMLTNEIFTWDKAQGRLVRNPGVVPACVEDLEDAGWRREAGAVAISRGSWV